MIKGIPKKLIQIKTGWKIIKKKKMFLKKEESKKVNRVDVDKCSAKKSL